MKISGKKLKLAIKYADLTQEQAAIKLGTTRQTLGTWFKYGELPDDILHNVKSKLNISLTNDVLSDHIDKEGMLSTYKEGAIPIYDMEVNAGMVGRLIDDNNNIPISGWLYLRGMSTDSGLVGVKAVGDSMATFINGGDIMLIRKLENYDFIPPGHAYVVISNELSIVKYVRNGKDESYWTLRSHNDKYEDFPVKREDVKHLFIVVRVIKELNY